MDLSFFEYALWTIAGLWSFLFVAGSSTGSLSWVARAIGLGLILLSLTRALLEKNPT